MGAAKVIGIFLIILLIPVGIVGFDLYQTSQVVQETDFSQAISSPSFSISDDNSTVTITVTVDIPKAGFIPKGIQIDVTADFDGEVQTEQTSISFGDTKNISLDFTLTQEHRNTIASGGSLTVTASAEITPIYLGFAISQLTQEVDLGSQTISR